MKKLLAVMLLAIFLIVSLGVISASEDSISIPVKVVWSGDAGDSVTVSLIKDGVVVDKATLNDGNSWKTTFKVNDDGKYKVSVGDSDKFTSSVAGNAESGFVVKATAVEDDVLASGDDDSPMEDTSKEDKSAENDDSVKGDDVPNTADGNGNDASNGGNTPAVKEDTNPSGNGTGNDTDNSTDQTNNTEPKDDSKKDKDTDDEKVTETTKTKTTTTTKIIKQDTKDDDKDKKPENTTKTKKNNTGLPIVVLIIAVIVAAFIPLSRKK